MLQIRKQEIGKAKDLSAPLSICVSVHGLQDVYQANALWVDQVCLSVLRNF
jgi:hypothetical protein